MEQQLILERMLGLLRDPLPALKLNGRELEVASMIANGLSRAEIADRIGISESSVKRYAMRVSRKAGFPAKKFPSHLIAELDLLIKEALGEGQDS